MPLLKNLHFSELLFVGLWDLFNKLRTACKLENLRNLQVVLLQNFEFESSVLYMYVGFVLSMKYE